MTGNEENFAEWILGKHAKNIVYLYGQILRPVLKKVVKDTECQFDDFALAIIDRLLFGANLDERSD